MNSPAWREVKLSPRVLEKLSFTLEDQGLSSDYADAWRDVLQHVIDAFRELWEELHEAPDGTRSYLFFGDDMAPIVFYARVQATVIYDLSIVEQIVEIFDVAVMPGRS